jgi:2-haloacid dehalogenase
MTTPESVRFDDTKALSFDCYGTLIDWEAGIVNALQHVVEAEFPSMRYPDVLAASLRRIAADFGADATDIECVEFGASVGAWPAFADTAVALRRLHERYKLIIVSNIDRASFAASNRRLGVAFDLVITAEDVGAYKPRHEHFTSMFERLGELDLERHELVHVAQSLFHDHGPAQQLGLPSVWIDRRGDRLGTGATPAVAVTVPDRFASLAAFADAALGTTR